MWHMATRRVASGRSQAIKTPPQVAALRPAWQRPLGRHPALPSLRPTEQGTHCGTVEEYNPGKSSTPPGPRGTCGKPDLGRQPNPGCLHRWSRPSTHPPLKGSSGQDQDDTLTGAPDQLAPAPGREVARQARVWGLCDVLQLCHKWAPSLQWEGTPHSLPKLLVDAGTHPRWWSWLLRYLQQKSWTTGGPSTHYRHFWGPLTYRLSRELEFFLQACRIAELKASAADILASATSASLQVAFRPRLENNIGGSRAGGPRPINNHLADYQGVSRNLPTSRRGPRSDPTVVVTGVRAGERVPARGVGPTGHTLPPKPNLDAHSAVRSHADLYTNFYGKKVYQS
ncbi:hypothetical protein Vafri_295 [Volvox africanus]|nr:hypothetical protein Vafri_295 [Volvox africanus]